MPEIQKAVGGAPYTKRLKDRKYRTSLLSSHSVLNGSDGSSGSLTARTDSDQTSSSLNSSKDDLEYGTMEESTRDDFLDSASSPREETTEHVHIDVDTVTKQEGVQNVMESMDSNQPSNGMADPNASRNELDRRERTMSYLERRDKRLQALREKRTERNKRKEGGSSRAKDGPDTQKTKGLNKEKEQIVGDSSNVPAGKRSSKERIDDNMLEELDAAHVLINRQRERIQQLEKQRKKDAGSEEPLSLDDTSDADAEEITNSKLKEQLVQQEEAHAEEIFQLKHHMTQESRYFQVQAEAAQIQAEYWEIRTKCMLENHEKEMDEANEYIRVLEERVRAAECSRRRKGDKQ